MRAKLVCLAVALMPLVAVSASSQEPTPTPKSSLGSVVNSGEAVPEAPPPPPQPAAPVPEKSPEEIARTVSLLLRVAQLMMVRLEGMSAPSHADRQLLEQVPPGGVVLPRLLHPEALATYISTLRTSRNLAGQPLMIGIDLMGAGRESGLGAAHGLRVPAMLTTAAAGPGPQTAALYAAQAADLATLGFDFHWGPSLGLASPVAANVELMDSFGSLPGLTASLAGQIGQALGQRNLAWAPTGFPGGVAGAAQRSPAVVLTPRSQLREVDFKPYEAAIRAGARMIHVGTTLVPSLDEDRPACLSPIVIRDGLRDALDFQGIVIAGPMDSPNISRISDTSTAAVEALVSGADMIYWEGSGPRVARAIVDIVQAVERGILPETIVNDAFTRVISFKSARGLAAWPLPDTGDVNDVAKQSAKRREPMLIERSAVTLLRNRDDVLPLKEGASEPIGVTGAYGVIELHETLLDHFKGVGRQPIRTAEHATRIQDFEIERVTRQAGGVRTAIITLSPELELAGQVKLIRALKLRGPRVVAVLLGQPKNLDAYEDADALVLAYGDTSRPEETVAVLADVLMGDAPVQVLPPVRALELARGEEATFDVHEVVRTPAGRLPIALGAPYDAGHAVSFRSDAVLENIRWNFGDGKQSRTPVTTHTYKSPGTYNVTLRVGRKYPAEGSFQVIVK